MMKTRERGVAGGVKEMMGTLGEEGERMGGVYARTHAHLMTLANRGPLLLD